MKTHFQKSRQSTQNFLEKRLIFVNKYNESDNDSEQREKMKVREILNNKEKSLSPKDKWFLRKHRQDGGLRTEIRDRLIIEDKNLDETIRKYPSGITENDIQELSYLPAQDAINRGYFSKYLFIIQDILSKGGSSAINLRKNLEKELTAGFLSKYKKVEGLVNIRELIDGKNADEVLEESNNALRDAKLDETKNAVNSNMGIEQKSRQDKNKILSAVRGVLSKSQVEEVQNILEKEESGYENQITGMVQAESERRFQKSLGESLEKGVSHIEKIDNMIVEILRLVYQNSPEGEGIIAGYNRKAKRRKKQMQILSGGQMLDDLQNYMDEPEDANIALKIVDKEKELKKDVKSLINKRTEATQEFYSLHKNGNSDAILEGQGNMLKMAEKVGIKKEYVRKNEKELREKVAKELALPLECFEETEELAEKYGLSEDKIVQIANGKSLIGNTNISQENKFLVKTLEDEESSKMKNSEFLKDFFSVRDENMSISCMRKIFSETAIDEKEALDTLIAPSEAELESLENTARASSEDFNRRLGETRNSLETKKEQIENALKNSENPKILKAVLSHIEKALKKLDEQIKISEKINTEGDKLLSQGIKESLKGINNSILEAEKMSKYFQNLDLAEVEKISKPAEIKSLADNITSLPTKAERQNEKLKEQQEKIAKIAKIRDLALDNFNGKEVDIKENLKELKNLDNTPVLELVSEEKFRKDFPKERGVAYTKFDPKKGILKIYAIENKINDKFLAHETAHAFGIFSPKSVKTFYNKVKKEMGQNPALMQWRRQYKDEKEFAHELFAHFLGKDFTKGTVGELAQEIPRNFLDEKDIPSEEDFKKGVEKKLENTSFWKKAEGFYASEGNMGVAVEDESPVDTKRRKKLDAIFFSKKKEILRKMKDVKKSPSPDKDLFLQSIQEHISEAEESISGSSSESMYIDAIGEDGETGLGKVNEVLVGALNIITESAESQDGYFEELWDNTTFVSMMDIKRIWTVYADYMKRRHERKSKERSGKVGRAMFDGINNKLSSEYDLQVESAEKEEVSQYQESLDNKDAWQIYDRIRETTNADELKACLRELAKKGQISWRDQVIWDALHRFQNTVRFYDSDRDDVSILNQKMQRALAVLYDNDEYREIERDNQSSYDSRKKEYEKESVIYQDNLGLHIQKMLTQHKNGERIDPQRYEMFLERAVITGKFNPENVIYYLIQGVYEGLLSPERPQLFGAQYVNEFPLGDLISMRHPTIDQYKKWGSMFETPSGTPPPEFLDWIHTNWMTDKNVIERVQKSAGQGPNKWDHDWMQTIASIGSTTSAQTIIKEDANGVPIYQATAYPNVINGILCHFTSVAKNSQDLPRDELKHEWARQFGYAAMTDGILYDRIYKNERYFRLSEGDMDYHARENKYDSGSEKTHSTREISEKTRKIMKNVASDFFGELFKKDANPQKLAEILSSDKYSYTLGDRDISEFKRVEDFYEFVEIFTKKLFEKNPEMLEEALQGARDVYTEDHKDWKSNFKPWNWGVSGKKDVEAGKSEYFQK